MNKARLFLAVAAMIGLGAVLAGESVPNRLATAKVGEWASYKFPYGYTQKQTVINRTGDGPEAEVTVRIEDIYENEVVKTREMTQPAGEPMTQPQIPENLGFAISIEIEKRNATVKGKTILATVIEVEKDYDDDDDDEESEWWVSAEIPVFGLIKKVTDDEIVFEIVDYGE